MGGTSGEASENREVAHGGFINPGLINPARSRVLYNLPYRVELSQWLIAMVKLIFRQLYVSSQFRFVVKRLI